MLFPVQQLLEGRDAPLCVSRETKVSDALALMVENDYSQLPVVDESGRLVGIISEDSIMGTYYHVGGTVSLLDLTVDHCQKPAVVLSPESDIFEALDQLRNVYAIVIVQDQKPIGILTDYDTTNFFRDLSEGLILVEDIEVTLRQYIEAAFPTDKTMSAALMRAFKQDRMDPTKPAHAYEELTFGQHIQLITAEDNWVKFEQVFGPKNLFVQLMANVRDVRNQLAHFRGRLEPVQHHALIRARDWLAARPKLAAAREEAQTVRVTAMDVPSQRPAGKYTPLETWLGQLRGQERTIQVSLNDIETLLQDPLPPAAREHRSWWANDPASNTQCLAWMRAGWYVDDVDLAAGVVTFKQTDAVLMQLFFADLLQRFKEARPGITEAKKTQPANWFSFSAGKAGFSFGWTFTGKKMLQVELYIDLLDTTKTKTTFDTLASDKDAIEREFNAPLNWERLPNRRASRISLARPATITDPPEKLEQAKQWALETTIKFVNVFRPRIKELKN